MRFPKNGITGMIVLAAAGWAGAHLVDGSLHLSPAAPYAPGQQVTLTWQVSVLHDGKTNIDFSKDAGTSWTSIKTAFQAQQGSNTFKATIPNEETSHGIIRVCLGDGQPCGNVKISQPSTAPYTLVSGELTVTGTSGIQAKSKQSNSVVIDAETRRVSASFTLDQEANVSIQAFNLQGKLRSTFFEGRIQQGEHRLTFELPLEIASAPALVFQIKVGKSVRSQIWTHP